jgi:hypothetical protein
MSEEDFRIFYTRDSNRGMKTVDCRQYEDNLFYVKDDDMEISAIRTEDENSELLLEDGNIEDFSVEHIRIKEAPYEQYIYGGNASATKTYVRCYGEHTGRISLTQYSSTANVQVNLDTVIRGESDSVTSVWDWEIMNKGEAKFVRKDDELSDFIDKECIVVGYEDPIECINLVNMAFEESNDAWISQLANE